MSAHYSLLPSERLLLVGRGPSCPLEVRIAHPQRTDGVRSSVPRLHQSDGLATSSGSRPLSEGSLGALEPDISGRHYSDPYIMTS